MVTIYPKSFYDSHDIIDKSFFTGNNYDAKKERDDLARSLRKEGYTVKTHKSRFDTRDGYFLHATREKTLQEGISNVI
jgi:nitrite reductase/ring-hydroxylating ferredoxin subunit